MCDTADKHWMESLLWIELRFVLTRSDNIFVEEVYEGWHVVSAPVSSAVRGNIIMDGILIVSIGIEGGVSSSDALHIS